MRKTKIIATLGPATDGPERLLRLLDIGVNVFRLNMSHANAPWVRQVVKDIRKASETRHQAVGILLDTQGPAIRTGDLPAPLELKAGEHFYFVASPTAPPPPGRSTTVNYPGFAADVFPGNTLLVDNGEIKMRIVAKTADTVECEVLADCRLGNRRHINLPGVRVSLPALTDKDKEDVRLGLEVGVDFIALSFVREPSDIAELREFIRSVGSAHKPQIVAKIEHQFAVNHFEEIARDSDQVMIARGDLGVECPYEELPIIQRKIVKICQRIGKPVIVATHMLESMIQNPLPTRAEITDVANAVFEQADAIMLSGETSTGKYPFGCVEVMDTIAKRIERSGGANYHLDAELTSPRQKLVNSAVHLADELKAAAIIVFTRRGHMARFASWMRPRSSPIFAFAEKWEMADSLTLLRGVMPRVVAFDFQNPSATVENAIKQLVKDKLIARGDTLVVVTDVAAGDRIVDGMKLRVVD
ncbi:MAG TPA: pyruvate kinase [Candidatus Limnocylindria bacterium]|jgi:pyruvate kinase|nr:pyruvate kinase [Candidatus Limnocylindria bacterium]